MAVLACSAKEKTTIGYEDISERYFSLETASIDEKYGNRQGCKCMKDCINNYCECKQLSHNKGDIECCDHCKCIKQQCNNRKSQTPKEDMLLTVFDTKDKRGKGLKTEVDIPKDSFIIEYIGELLSNEEVKLKRSSLNKAYLEGNYILTAVESINTDLDNDELQTLQSGAAEKLQSNIDATEIGNVARFINHSCDPNCELRLVRKKSIRFPHFMIFAKTDVQANTELTVSYGLHKSSTVTTKDFNINRIKCLCGEKNCNKVLPLDMNVC